MVSMHPSRFRRLCRSSVAALAAVLVCSAAAWACPDAKPADKTSLSADKCAPTPADESVEAGLIGPAPEPGYEAPVLSGWSGAARHRDGDTRVNDGPLGWLLTSGPMGGLKLSAERLARSPERKGGAGAETPKASKPAGKRMAKAKGGAVGHIAKPHRMPSLEIL